jgi:hypothetical protein
LVDKAINNLTLWNGRQINPAGRLTLVKAVLTSQVVYFLTSLRAPKETLKDIDPQRKKFLWVGAEAITGGKCKVNWPRSAGPKYSGGLGILHLGKFARALRLRWLWRGWSTNIDRPWDGEETPCNKVDMLLFVASTRLTIGDGKRASFWKSAWLNGQRPCDVAPHLFSNSKRKNRTLHQALLANNWIHDINLRHPSFSGQHFIEYICLWRETRRILLRTGTLDALIWKFEENGEYSAASAYHAQFIGTTRNNFETIIWKPWAPSKCKFFSWLVIQNRIWTADRLEARWNWPNQRICPLCRIHAESGLHLFRDCRFTKCL